MGKRTPTDRSQKSRRSVFGDLPADACETGSPDLFLEEVGMGPCTDQTQFLSFNAVNQDPVRLDVSPTIILKLPS